MKNFTIKLEHNGMILHTNICAFTLAEAIEKAYRKFGG